MKLTSRTTIQFDPEIKAKKMSVKVAEILRTVGSMWKFAMMPHHFEKFSAAKYGYHPRTDSYTKRRDKQPPGYGRELMWSGKFFRAAATAPVRIATSRRKAYIRLVFRGGYTNKRTGISVRTDLFKTVASERERLHRLLKAGIYQWLWAKNNPKPIDQLGKG